MQLPQHTSVYPTRITSPLPIQFGGSLWKAFTYGGGDKANAARRATYEAYRAARHADGYMVGPYYIEGGQPIRRRRPPEITDTPNTTADSLPGTDSFSSTGKVAGDQRASDGDIVWVPDGDSDYMVACCSPSSQVARDAVADLSVVDIGRGVARGVHAVRRVVHNWFHSIDKMD